MPYDADDWKSIAGLCLLGGSRYRFAMRWLAVLMLLGGVAAADEAWEVTSSKDGVTVSKRKVSGSKYYEYQLVATAPVPPATFQDKVWKGVLDDAPPSVQKREVIRKSETEMVVYDHIHAKVVSDREVVLRLVRWSEGGVYYMSFDTANELGPLPDGKCVRLPSVHGKWSISADGGGSKLVYRCYSEPGGSVPAFLVRGAQQDQIMVDYKRALARTAR